MARQVQYRRLLMLALLLGAAFVGLGYRLVDLQVIRHERLSAKAQENTFAEASLEPRRGDILDVRGNVLATSTVVKTRVVTCCRRKKPGWRKRWRRGL